MPSEWEKARALQVCCLLDTLTPAERRAAVAAALEEGGRRERTGCARIAKLYAATQVQEAICKRGPVDQF